MKKRNILFAVAFALCTSLYTTSCIKDDSMGATETLPQLTVEGSDAETMPVYNFYLGDDCVLNPQVSYDGNAENLEYTWKVGTYANGQKGTLETVSNEKELKYKFQSGGSYYVHLTVTDGRVGKAADYQVNINRTFEEGYLLSSTDADGKGNLSFVKILTEEEKANGMGEKVIEHCLNTMNSDISEDKLIKAVIGSITWPKSLKRVVVSTEENCYFLDPNNFTVIANLRYSDLFSGFKASEFMPDSYVPYAYDKTMKKFAHLNLTYLFPFEYQYMLGAGDVEDFIFSKYSYYGRESSSTMFMNYTQNTACYFDAYGSYYGYDSNYPQCGPLPDGQKLLTGYKDATNAYIFAKEESTGDMYFWTYTPKSLDWYTYEIVDEKFESQKLAASANLAEPQQGTRFVVSPTYNRFYYAIDNKVFVFLPNVAFTLPNTDQYALQFDANEEVTFIDVNISTEELYVATYDKNTQRGNFYIYNCKDVRTDNASSVKPKETHKSCAGRISYLIYKPSIQ